MPKQIRPEDMDLIPSGNLTTRQWEAVMKRLAYIEKQIATAKEQAGALSANNSDTDAEAQVRTGIVRANHSLEMLAKEIASADRQAVYVK